MRKKSEYPGSFRDFVIDLAKTVSPKKGHGPLADIILRECQRILSKEIAAPTLEKQLLMSPIISYADHHSFLNYKLLYNTNLLYTEVIKALQLPYVIVFATGSIPLANKSHPRGFYFNRTRYNFFLNKHKNIPVYLLEEKINAARAGGIESLVLNYDKSLLTSEEIRFLDFLFFECLDIEKASKDYDTFSDQITFLNHKLWKYYFNGNLRDSIPNLIYLQSNRLIREFLTREIENTGSLIALLLFEPKVRRIFLENFNGIACCWGENMGSHLFWGVTEKKHMFPLKLDESSNSLVAEGFKIKLEKDAVIEALNSQKILPTSFFDLLLVTFLEGYLTLGGFNQLEYLPQMQQAHIKSLEEIGMTKMAEKFAARVTDGLICGMFPFDFDSGIDLIWHYNSRDGKFNGNLDHGLTQEDLNGMLDMKVKDMILSAIELMLENM